MFNRQSNRGDDMRATYWLGVALLCATTLRAQTGVRVELEDVIDNRMASSGSGLLQIQGGLELRVKLAGTNLDKAEAARIVVTEAKDDKGRSLLADKPRTPDFMGRDVNMGMLQFSVNSPNREASTVRIKGNVELYVPGRDPNANVKIDNALAKLDTPLSHKSLKAAKIDLTPLSADGYKKLVTARQITDKDVAELRARGKAEGASDQEIEMMIDLAKAMDESEQDLPPNAVAISGRKDHFDRIYRVEVLGADGEPVHMTTRGTSSRGDDAIMTLQPSDALPSKAALQLMLLTDKTVVTVPFDLKVQLP
jgi:hypothetical protein